MIATLAVALSASSSPSRPARLLGPRRHLAGRERGAAWPGPSVGRRASRACRRRLACFLVAALLAGVAALAAVSAGLVAEPWPRRLTLSPAQPSRRSSSAAASPATVRHGASTSAEQPFASLDRRLLFSAVPCSSAQATLWSSSPAIPCHLHDSISQRPPARRHRRPRRLRQDGADGGAVQDASATATTSAPSPTTSTPRRTR